MSTSCYRYAPIVAACLMFSAAAMLLLYYGRRRYACCCFTQRSLPYAMLLSRLRYAVGGAARHKFCRLMLATTRCYATLPAMSATPLIFYADYLPLRHDALMFAPCAGLFTPCALRYHAVWLYAYAPARHAYARYAGRRRRHTAMPF